VFEVLCSPCSRLLRATQTYSPFQSKFDAALQVNQEEEDQGEEENEEEVEMIVDHEGLERLQEDQSTYERPVSDNGLAEVKKPAVSFAPEPEMKIEGQVGTATWFAHFLKCTSRSIWCFFRSTPALLRCFSRPHGC